MTTSHPSPRAQRSGLAGRLLLSFVAVVTSISPILADFNETHIFNPAWLPHARFHSGMSISMGFGLGLIALWLLWRRSTDPTLALRAAAWIDALYWLAFIPARLVPGTALVDPGHDMPRPLGIHVNFFIALLGIALTAAGYWLASRSVPPARPQSALDAGAPLA
jgi:uncharacterized protein DUF6640